MREVIEETGNELKERWHQKMPRLFYWISVVAMCLLCIVVTIHFTVEAAGAQHVEWWGAAYPYIVGVCAGIITICKLTVNGGYKKLDPDNLTGNTILNKDDN